MSQNIESPLLDNDEAAAYLDTTPLTMRAWVFQKRIPHIKMGKSVRFLKSDLDAYLKSCRVPAAKK